MRRVRITDYVLEDIDAGSFYAIFDVKCPYCEKNKHVKTREVWNRENTQKCDCGERFLVIFDD